jgi:hypothetical protein
LAEADASFITWRVDDEEHALIESGERLFGTKAEALAWFATEAARRGFVRYTMVRS